MSADPRLIELPQFDDPRGQLTVVEFGEHLPFTPQRCFVVSAVPNQRVRGEHAHRRCEQVLICLAGSCAVSLDDGASRVEYELDGSRHGLHVEPMVWASQYRYTHDAVVLVLASRPYEPEDYIRDYDAFLHALRGSA